MVLGQPAALLPPLLGLPLIIISLLPQAGLLVNGGGWPGFYYAPFYTTNIFTGPDTPAGRAGLRPEDRVIGLNGERVERLAGIYLAPPLPGAQATLVYELGLKLATVRVNLEKASLTTLLEKWGAALLAGLALLGLGWRGRNLAAGLAGLALVAGTDYWFGPGAGRESGFDPAFWLERGRWDLAAAKWSTYIYWPLWSLAWLATGYRLSRQLAGRGGRLALAGLGSLAAAQLTVYAYEAARTAIYNNPDYIIRHIRLIFWPGWGGLLALAVLVAWRMRSTARNRLAAAGLALFAAGFMGPTVFDTAWPGPGPQWYAPALLLLWLPGPRK